VATLKINKKNIYSYLLDDSNIRLGFSFDNIDDSDFLDAPDFEGWGCGFNYTLDFSTFSTAYDGEGHGCGESLYNYGDPNGDGGGSECGYSNGDGHGWGYGYMSGNGDGDFNEFLIENSNFVISM
jgi:hypothetical protein